MINRDLRRKLVPMCMFVLPLVLVRGAAWYFSLTPEAAAENIISNDGPDIDVGPKPFKPTREQRAAREYLAELAELPFAESPMYYQRREGPTVKQPVEVTTDDTLAVEVTLIIEGSKGSTALVDSKPYRVGDLLEGTKWRVSGIDSATRTVEFQHDESGETSTARVPAPEVPVPFGGGDDEDSEDEDFDEEGD